jgi:cobyrinic acid a,c-diamide synthase
MEGCCNVNLPRLIIADEIKPGINSPALTLIYAMKRVGIKLKIFVCARDELDMRMLKLLLEEPVVSLDAYLCGSVKILKTLFQETAAPDALNLILIPLGTRLEDGFMQVRPEISEIAKSLSCRVIAMLNAESSAIQAANDAISALSMFDEPGGNYVQGVIFLSPKNPREYQLLEQDFGRRTHIMSLGYIPKEIERARPSLQSLFSASASTYVMQAKSSVLQLLSNQYLIEWQVLEALGGLGGEWTPPQESHYMAKNFKVAVVGDSLFSLEGANAVELFKFLGCETVDYNPLKDPFPMDATLYYFPNSLIELYADKLLSHEPFAQGIRQAFAASKLIFANGASAPFFGRYFFTADGQKHEGLNFFPLHGNYSSPKGSRRISRVEIRSISDSIIGNRDEKMRGYSLDYAHISNPGNIEPPLWAYRDSLKDTELGCSGWQKSYCFITELYLEFWSGIDVINRWLALRKK